MVAATHHMTNSRSRAEFRQSGSVSPTTTASGTSSKVLLHIYKREGAGRSAPFCLLPAERGLLLDGLSEHNPPHHYLNPMKPLPSSPFRPRAAPYARPFFEGAMRA